MKENRTRSFLFLAADAPWIYQLALNIADYEHVDVVRFYDIVTYLRQRPEWPYEAGKLSRSTAAFPPGYAGMLSKLFRPIIGALIHHRVNQLRRRTGSEPYLICPYPWLYPFVKGIGSSQVAYFNVDDYAVYDPVKAKVTQDLESNFVRKARLITCSSLVQRNRLRERVPEASQKIHHFPHGVPKSFINNAKIPPRPNSVGYVGTLSDRVDWNLFEIVANRLEQVEFHVVGNLCSDSGLVDLKWYRARARVFKLPNVVFHGPVRQDAVYTHYWRYSVNWMPYDVKNALNIASCPTKLMDALASGRPFVSTDIPESHLYHPFVRCASNADECVYAIVDALRAPEKDISAQLEFSRKNTWEQRALAYINYFRE